METDLFKAFSNYSGEEIGAFKEARAPHQLLCCLRLMCSLDKGSAWKAMLGFYDGDEHLTNKMWHLLFPEDYIEAKKSDALLRRKNKVPSNLIKHHALISGYK